MKFVCQAKFVFALFFLASNALAAVPASLDQFHQWVLESVAEMPKAGGYELTARPPTRLRDSFTWDFSQTEPSLLLDVNTATPSYCTTATYQVFYKVLEKYWAWSHANPSKEALAFLKPQLESDGARAWGRWNANGPGTAKLLKDAGMAMNSDRFEDAVPGDFLKIFWNGEVGKLEKGHSVIYLGTAVMGGVPMVSFWSSNQSTQGYSVRTVKKSQIAKIILTKIDHFENFENLRLLLEKDEYLAELPNRRVSWSEVQKVSGIIP